MRGCSAGNYSQQSAHHNIKHGYMRSGLEALDEDEAEIRERKQQLDAGLSIDEVIDDGKGTIHRGREGGLLQAGLHQGQEGKGYQGRYL